MLNSTFFKKCLICVLVCTIGHTLSAQMFAGGGLGFNSAGVSDGEFRISTFNISPTVGYFLSDEIVVGGTISLTGTRTSADGEEFVTSTGWGINPFARYRKEVGGDVALYLEGGLSVGFGNISFFDSDVVKQTAYTIYAGPGIEYSINDNFFVNTLLGSLYYQATTLEDADFNSNAFGINALTTGLTVNLNYMF